VQEEKGNQIPVSFEALVPEIYMPRLQLFVRMMLGTMSAVYFNYIPIPPLILTVTPINLIVVSYYAFHVFWWWYYQRYGAKIIMLRLGSWIDIMGAATMALCDPYIIPPMILLLLIAVLGNGIQHGLYVFVESMIGALILGGAVLVIHCSLLGDWPPYNLYFYVFLIVVGVYYSYLLVRRLELMKMEAIRISEHDSLTGILNRRAFLRAAEYLLLLNERARIPLVFIFADLDNFKAVNDQFGHEMGDKVLRHFSDMARSRFRKSDIIARYGGDEFVMILTNTSLEGAELAVQRLQREFRDWARNNGLQVDFSFGLETAPEGRNNLDDILRQVDAALYDAKRKRGQISKVLPIVKTKNGAV
jgi:diguanylate cyclase (GGDEF)-like protein